MNNLVVGGVINPTDDLFIDQNAMQSASAMMTHCWEFKNAIEDSKSCPDLFIALNKLIDNSLNIVSHDGVRVYSSYGQFIRLHNFFSLTGRYRDHLLNDLLLNNDRGLANTFTKSFNLRSKVVEILIKEL